MSTSSLICIGGIVLVISLGYTYYKKRCNKPTQNGNYTPKVSNVSPQATEKPVNKQVNSRPRTSAVTFNQYAAREAFIRNIQRFAPLLQTLNNKTYNSNQWSTEIIDINDKDLTELWKLIHSDELKIKRILSQWGITSDTCTSFQCFDFHKEMYCTSDGSALKTGETYNVSKPCWILTIQGNSGKTTKSIIIKGEVK